MARVARTRPTTKRGRAAYAVGAAVVVLVVVSGLAFVNSVRVARVTDNARSLHWVNATMGTSALTRAGLAQAVTFAELERDGLVGSAELEFAIEQLGLASGELQDLFEIGDGHDSYAALARFLEPVSSAIEDLERDDVTSAKEIVSTQVETAYLELVDSLETEQSSIQAAIDDHSAEGRAVNGWIMFVLTLVVPGSAVVVYYVIARRQMKAIRERNRLEIEAERTISRAKDTFIVGLSHELRTPLTSIYGFAEILADGDVKGTEAVGEAAMIIAKESAEMARMVDDLLVASRLGSTGVEVDLVRTSVTQVVDDALTPFRRAGLKVRWEPTPTFVATDGPRLRQILVNLLSNASRHGGPNVGIDVTEGDGTVDIEVWDDGPGISDDHIDSLFDPFVHQDDTPLLTGSLGLGLAVASRLAALLGGKLQYQRFGGKTFFVVTLPTSLDAATDDTDDSESVASMIRALSE